MELFRLTGNDFEKATETFAATYSLPILELTPSEAPFEWGHSASGNEILTLRSTRLMAHFEALVGAGDEFVVQWIRSGSMLYDAPEGTKLIGERIPFLLPNGRSTMIIRGTDVNTRLVHISKQFVRDVAQELPDVNFTTFPPVPPRSLAALQLWRRAIDLAASLLLTTGAPADSLLGKEINRLVAVALLDSYPYIYTDKKLGTHGTEPAGVKRAYDYVHHNAHLPIGPLDIAQAAQLSVRSLQNALRRHRETTPIALLRSVRLTRVRDELLTAEPNRTTITQVARAWGFIQMGRFAEEYRTQFGELPRDTLRRPSTTGN